VHIDHITDVVRFVSSSLRQIAIIGRKYLNFSLDTMDCSGSKATTQMSPTAHLARVCLRSGVDMHTADVTCKDLSRGTRDQALSWRVQGCNCC